MADDGGGRFESPAVHDAGWRDRQRNEVECEENAQVDEENHHLEPWKKTTV